LNERGFWPRTRGYAALKKSWAGEAVFDVQGM